MALRVTSFCAMLFSVSWLFLLDIPQHVSGECPFYGCYYSQTGRGLTEVSTNIPQPMTSINLDDNNITKVTTHVFSCFSECQYLSLREKSISEIEPQGFLGLSLAWRLYLSGDELTEIWEDMWKGLDSLMYLTLSGNKIQSLESSAFRYLSRLALQGASLEVTSAN